MVESGKRPRKVLTDHASRLGARRTRDWQWSFMERLAREGTIHVCPWNKYRLEEQPHELMLCLFSGMDLFAWIGVHQDWFEIGEPNQQRHTTPISLTNAGHLALKDRDRYDMEPVYGGLIEPGWQAIPLPRP